MRLRILTDSFRQKCVCKALKYIQYSCGFTPFSGGNPLAKLPCRFTQSFLCSQYVPAQKNYAQKRKALCFRRELLSRRQSRGFADGSFAVSCARPLCAGGAQRTHLEPEKCFSRRTRRHEKLIELRSAKSENSTRFVYSLTVSLSDNRII